MSFGMIEIVVEILKEIGLFAVLHKFFAKETGGEGSVAERIFRNGAEHAKKVAEWRVELEAYLNDMKDQVAAQNLRDWWDNRQNRRPRPYGDRRPYSYGEEVTFVTLLVSFYRYLSDRDELSKRDRLFQAWGRLTPEEFDLTFERLKDDTGWQWLRQTAERVSATLEASVVPTLTAVNDGWSAWLDRQEAARRGRRTR